MKDIGSLSHKKWACKFDRQNLWREAKNFVGQHFQARGYFVSAVGREEGIVRKYIQEQERED